MTAAMAVVQAEAGRHYPEAIPRRKAELAEDAKRALCRVMERADIAAMWFDLAGHEMTVPQLRELDAVIAAGIPARRLYAALSGYFLDVAAAAERAA